MAKKIISFLMNKKIIILFALFILLMASAWQITKYENNLLANILGGFSFRGNDNTEIIPPSQEIPQEEINELLSQLNTAENQIESLNEKISFLEKELDDYQNTNETLENFEPLVLSEDTQDINPIELTNENDTPVPITELCQKTSGAISAKDIMIINEIAWMGSVDSPTHEWIELKNISQSEINLSGWQLFNKDNQIKITFDEKHTIPSNEFLLLERTNDESVPHIAADLLYSGALRNSNEALYLFNKDCSLQDEVETDSDWPNGDNASAAKRTMERTVDMTWQTSLNPGGTPRTQNSAGYTAPSIIQSSRSRGGGSSTQSQPTINLSFPSENLTNQEILTSLSIANAKNTDWDVKISIEKEGVTLSEIYNAQEEKWQSSFSYITKAFFGSSFEGELKLRIKEEFRNSFGIADIVTKIRENEKSTSYEFLSTINLTEPEEEAQQGEENNDEEEQDPEENIEPMPTMPNFLLNEFFEEWEEPVSSANDLHDWQYSGTASHITRSEESLIGQYSANWTPITSANNLTQENVLIEHTGIHNAVLWIKPLNVSEDNYIRISLDVADPENGNFPNASFVDYKTENEWIEIKKTADLSAGENGGLRIRAQRVGPTGPSFLIGSAWLSTNEPPEDWLAQGNIEEDDEDSEENENEEDTENDGEDNESEGGDAENDDTENGEDEQDGDNEIENTKDEEGGEDNQEEDATEI